MKHRDGTILNSGRAYERSDVSVPAIIKFAVGLIVAAAVVHFLVWGMFRYLSEREAKLEPRPSPLMATPAERLPPEPRLQGAPGSRFPLKSPMLEMQEMRATEQAMLESYGWIDKKAGIVRIPLERAMKLVVGRGLPVRKESSSQHRTANEQSSASVHE